MIAYASLPILTMKIGIVSLTKSKQFSVDLDHPYRLIFEPEEPIPRKDDGGIDWSQVTTVVILGVEDTHE